MPLPPFQSDGLLPPNVADAPYVCRLDEVHQRLVVDRGKPPWRERLFEGWDQLRLIVADFNPATVWWLWGAFVSTAPEPLFGEHETISAAALMPAESMPAEVHRRAALRALLQRAEHEFYVDVIPIYDFPADHPDHLLTVEELELKVRPRASKGIADFSSKELVPAGYVEVRP